MPLPQPTTSDGQRGLVALLADPDHALIAVDFDGTLAPIVPRPEDARPAPGAVEALAAVARQVGTVAVITGRPLESVLELSGFATVPDLGDLVILGHYGLERWDAKTGVTTRPSLPPGVAAVRRQLPDLLARADAAPGTTIEDKGSSLAVHTRRTDDPAAALAALRTPLEALAAGNGLEVAPGRFVLELRPPGTDKGAALRSVVAGRVARAVLFAGDDLGDLPAYDAVEALRRQGVPGVKVCSASDEAPEVRERADLVVDGPAAVVSLLRELATALETSPA